MACREVGVPMARIFTELKPPDDVTGLLLGYRFHPFSQEAIIALYRELGPILLVEAETLVFNLLLGEQAG